MKIKLLAVFLTLLLAGCMTMGTKVTPDQMASLHKGLTTQAQAIALLGDPHETVHNSDGTTTLSYVRAHAKPSASMFIPIVGAFVGHDTATYVQTDLVFDQSGVLKDIRQSQGTIVAGAFHSTQTVTQAPHAAT